MKNEEIHTVGLSLPHRMQPTITAVVPRKLWLARRSPRALDAPRAEQETR